MSAESTVRYPIPGELARLPRERSAVVEASAGTGKTFLIEHLVVDRLVRGEARLDEMLVVTFTEKAAAELQRRVRTLIRTVLDHQGPALADDAPLWEIDDRARGRLAAALLGVDAAPISTIHAFCQGVLTEHAFASGRPLLQQSVESRAAFSAAFAEVLREELAVDPAEAPYLAAYLAAPGNRPKLVDLEKLLYDAHQLRAHWGTTFDPARVTAAALAFARLDPAFIERTASALKGSPGKAVRVRLPRLQEITRSFAADGDLARLLSALDVPFSGSDLLAFITERFKTGEVAALVAELAEAATPLETVVAQRFVPRVAARLQMRKRALGLFDFDDMLTLVAEALRGPVGGALIATLRARFKLAVVDEFQDTDPIQWEIFRAIFDDRAGRPLYLVGDPKQAIYGFRGADVATYTAACASVAVDGDTHHLNRNFRSSRAVIDAYNAILDQTAFVPYFTGGVRYDPPVVYGPTGTPAPLTAELPALVLLRVTATEEVEKLPMRSVREGLARAVAGEIATLVAATPPTRPSDIFVLTRTWREASAVAAALDALGLPAVISTQDNLYASPEARHLRDLLRAIADPRDPAKRLRAWLTPFFGLTLADLPAAAAADGDHPLYARLFAWHAAAAREPLGRLYARILTESGVVLRELFLGDGARRLVNIRHLCEVLAAEDARGARPRPATSCAASRRCATALWRPHPRRETSSASRGTATPSRS
jgi:exodeoxyribonuclease V beta subunit